MATKTRSVLRKVRHVRVRKRVFGTAERPRLAVFRSLKHISAQLIDDVAQKTVCSASSMEGELKSKGNRDGAKSVGIELGKRAKAMGINAAVFDRGGFKYHGTISSLADGAREAGLEF